MCRHWLVNKPSSNKENACLNKITQDKWNKDHAMFKKYIKLGHNPLLDKNDKVLTKHKNLTLLFKLLVCHCWHNKHEAFAGGKKCFLNCFDPKVKTWHKLGKCLVCVCLCHFVCSKE